MLILGLDFETTGLNIPTIGVTEVGMVVWDTELHAPIKLFGTLVDPGPDIIWEPGATKVNKLTPEVCAKYGMSDEKACRYTLSWYGSADVACAHNGNVFDKLILEKWAKHYGLDAQPDKIWIDTKADLETPPGNATRLTYMAADHEFLNPFPHRAMFDVMTMLKILDKHDINHVLEISKSPTLKVRSLQPFEQNNLARNRGFHPEYEINPDGTKGKFKYWSMAIKECKLDDERVACRTLGFEIEVIK
jgi:DNA polymerase III subunit epsilon